MRSIRFLEIAAEFGAGTPGSSLGIDAIRLASVKMKYNIFNRFPSERISGDQTFLFGAIETPTAKRIQAIYDVLCQTAGRVQSALRDGEFPFILSGDHSNAYGTIAGIKMAYPEKRLGVVWIDAHGDLHTPFTSISGNMHGMPVAAALGMENRDLGTNTPKPQTYQLWNDLIHLGGSCPKILPHDLVFIGIRDLEKEEWDVIRRENIQYFTNQDVNEKGIRQVLREIQGRLSECDILYVSFDVDSMDEAFVPGTGTPVPDGLSLGQAELLLEAFWHDPRLVSLEITEVNPLLDLGNETAEIAVDLIHELISQETPG